MTSETTVSNPYVGPRTFSYEERRQFFGREREARDLLARVLSERLLLFYAQSGAGKSSLLHTRLIPQLQEEKGFGVLPVGRVGGEIPTGIEQVENVYVFNLMLSIDAGSDASRLARVTLSDFLARLTRTTVADATGQQRKAWLYDESRTPAPDGAPPGGRRYALIIDQFEEIVTAHAEHWQQREEFFRQLDQAMRDDPNLWVVLTLREDYIAALDPYAPLMTDRLRARFYMERMGLDAALEAIRRPAEMLGRPFAPGVAETLRDDLSQVRVPGREDLVVGQYVEPVQLQVVCYQLWENVSQRPLGPITAEDRQPGDVDAALTQFYEKTLTEVLAEASVQKTGVTERQLRQWFDKELIAGEHKRDLVRQGEETTGSMPNVVVAQLQTRFLVHSQTRSGDTWIELVHDRFVQPITESNRTWFARHQHAIGQAAQAWIAANRNPSQLYTGRQLEQAEAQLQVSPKDFGDLEREFLRESRVYSTGQTNRRQRQWLVGGLFVILALVALTAFALNLSRQALAAQKAAVAAQQNEAALRGRAIQVSWTSEAKVAALAQQVQALELLVTAEAVALPTATRVPTRNPLATPTRRPAGMPTPLGQGPTPAPAPTSAPVPAPPTAAPAIPTAGVPKLGPPFKGKYPVTQLFGEHPESYRPFRLAGSPGLNFGVPAGTAILAVDDGVVGRVNTDGTNMFGFYVRLDHNWGQSWYTHLSTIAVEQGATVKRGDVIGLSGNTGNAFGALLGFLIRVNPFDPKDSFGGFSDPLPYLDPNSVATP